MERRFRIKEAARERCVTLSSIAKRLGIPRSNMSAIASGARGVSLKALTKICIILGCGLDEIVLPAEHPPVFKSKKTQQLLGFTERSNYDGMDKTWVHGVAFAYMAHYKTARKAV